MSRGVFAFGLVVIGLLIVSLYHAKYGARDTDKAMMHVEMQIDDARRETALLETELAHMSRREWVEEIARDMGMSPPRPEQIINEGALDSLVGKPVADKVSRAKEGEVSEDRLQEEEAAE